MPDYTVGDTVYKRFTTRAFATGIPTTLAGTPVVSAYEDDSATQITAGITLGVDHDSVGGLNLLTIVATGANGYEAGKSYDFVITTGTVGGVSVVGEVVWHFTLSAEAAPVLIAAQNDPTVDAIADGVWDEVLTGGTHNVANSAGRRLRQLQEAGGYMGRIWIDTVNGTAGTTDFENGTDTFPVDSIADANTLAASLGISIFQVAPGSTITLAAAQNNQVFESDGDWTLALGGQDIGGSVFMSATVSGVGVNASGKQYFINCHMDATTVPDGTHIVACHMAGTITLGEAGTYIIDSCFSTLAGATTPILDFGAALNASNVSNRHYAGGIEYQNMGAGTGTYNLSVEGTGHIIFNANCSATSVVEIRGAFEVTNNASGLTITDEANNNQTVALSALVTDATKWQGADIPAILAAIPTATENADELLTRDWTSVTGEAARSVLNALRFLRNKWSIAGSTLTVTEEDDSTTAWTGTVTTDAAADPVTGNDPA